VLAAAAQPYFSQRTVAFGRYGRPFLCLACVRARSMTWNSCVFPIGHLAPRLFRRMTSIMWTRFATSLGGRLLNASSESSFTINGAEDSRTYNSAAGNHFPLPIVQRMKPASGYRMVEPGGGAFGFLEHVRQKSFACGVSGRSIEKLLQTALEPDAGRQSNGDRSRTTLGWCAA